MGDASISIASKGKAVIGGLLKRVTGGKPENEEAAPRTGVSLRDRFSALRPSAAPTDPIPQKISEELPKPDAGKDVRVIQTSAVRSSGSVRFSDRIGLSAASDSRDSFERKVSFEDTAPEEESATISEREDHYEVPKSRFGSQSRLIFEEEAQEISADDEDAIPEDMSAPVEEDGGYAAADIPFAQAMAPVDIEGAEAVGITDAREAPSMDIRTEAEEEQDKKEVMSGPAMIKAEPKEMPRPEATAEKVEVRKAARPEPTDVRAETKVETKADVRTNAKAEAEARPKTEAPISLSNDEYDGGYDFLPRRITSDRFAAMNGETKTTQPKAQTRNISIRSLKNEASKKISVLAERLKSRQTEKVPVKPKEVQLDGPVIHEGATRTSLLDRIMKERTTGKSVSEVIRETEQRIPEAREEAASAFEDIEEYDADLSAPEESHVMTERRTFISDAADEIVEEIIAEEADLHEPEAIEGTGDTYTGEHAEIGTDEYAEEGIACGTEAIEPMTEEYTVIGEIAVDDMTEEVDADAEVIEPIMEGTVFDETAAYDKDEMTADADIMELTTEEELPRPEMTDGAVEEMFTEAEIDVIAEEMTAETISSDIIMTDGAVENFAVTEDMVIENMTVDEIVAHIIAKDAFIESVGPVTDVYDGTAAGIDISAEGTGIEEEVIMPVADTMTEDSIAEDMIIETVVEEATEPAVADIGWIDIGDTVEEMTADTEVIELITEEEEIEAVIYDTVEEMTACIEITGPIPAETFDEITVADIIAIESIVAEAEAENIIEEHADVEAELTIDIIAKWAYEAEEKTILDIIAEEVAAEQAAAERADVPVIEQDITDITALMVIPDEIIIGTDAAVETEVIELITEGEAVIDVAAIDCTVEDMTAGAEAIGLITEDAPFIETVINDTVEETAEAEVAESIVADLAEMTGEAVSDILFAFDLEDEVLVEPAKELQAEANIDMAADIAEMTGEAVSDILFAFDLEDETPVESKEEVQTDAKIDMIADIAEMTGEAVSEILFAFDLEDEVCAEPAEMAEAGEDTEVTTETVITDTYDPLKEIETDAPVSDASMEHGRTDNAESDMLTLFEGVIMDDEIVPMACVPEISSAVPGGPTSEVRAMDDGHAYMYLEPEINKRCATMPSLEDEVWNVHFSFPSEKNQSSSADVRFNWG